MSKWRYKMHVISNRKNDFLRFLLSIFFFCWKTPRGSVRKNVKLMGHVCFVNQALFFLMESAKNHVMNAMNQTVSVSTDRV